ncbi:hypothetical protein O181_061133 [Austropuccinia psidii MF-1]|uniref:Uncharacterized protein n=1 Tax=Austropuccinia psidii MF-1 TaxID=1389203 RepID=A0A9Q3EHJ7_9BASI|nr:hypothetical protein [Austropuccinia psidii MF-1]
MHGQLAILSILGQSTTHTMEWLFGHINGPKPQIWPSGHILLHWPFWQMSNLTTPKFGPGGSSSLPGASGPSINIQGLWLSPFWPNCNDSKRGQGGRPAAPMPGGPT